MKGVIVTTACSGKTTWIAQTGHKDVVDADDITPGPYDNFMSDRDGILLLNVDGVKTVNREHPHVIVLVPLEEFRHNIGKRRAEWKEQTDYSDPAFLYTQRLALIEFANTECLPVFATFTDAYYYLQGEDALGR
jgi:hypothetical protein